MFKKFGFAWALTLAAGLTLPSVEPKPFLTCGPNPLSSFEARMEQQKSNWAPNGMKVLIIHGKRRWVTQGFPVRLEKSGMIPIWYRGI